MGWIAQPLETFETPVVRCRSEKHMQQLVRVNEVDRVILRYAVSIGREHLSGRATGGTVKTCWKAHSRFR